LPNGVSSTRVADAFNFNRGQAAFTPYGGNTIYINANILNVDFSDRNEALIMHELMHSEWGLSDFDIQEALGLDTSRPSANITEWLRENCVNGDGNR
jgi:hypothetical protein